MASAVVRRVVVIGGGIAGLACARELVDACPDVEVTLLEATAALGGVIATRQQGGFLCEAGPHGFLNRDPSTVELALRLGLRDELLAAEPAQRGRFVYRAGRLRRFPDTLGRFFATDLLSLPSKARVLCEPWVAHQRLDGDVSIEHYLTRRLGAEATRLLAGSVLAGTFGGAADELSLEAALPPLAALARRRQSLVGTAWRHFRSPSRPPDALGLPQGGLVSFRGGTAQLVTALAQSLAGVIVTAAPVREVSALRQGFVVRFDGGELAADAVVAATPAGTAATYLPGELAAVLRGFASAPIATVALGLDAAAVQRPPSGFGYLVPPGEPGAVLGVLWSSNMFPGRRCPDGRLQVQAIVGGTRAPRALQASDDELLDEVLAQLRPILGLGAAPLAVEIFRHPQGIAQYQVGHLQRVAHARALAAATPGLVLLGSSYDGVGINSCTAAAVRAVAQVSEHLRRSPAPARRHSKVSSSAERQRSSP